LRLPTAEVLAVTVLLLLTACETPVQQRPNHDSRSADNILIEAKRIAQKQEKNVFVMVGASWCKPCDQFWDRLKTEPASVIMKSSYVMVKLNGYGSVPEASNAGTDEWTAAMALGGQPAGIPYYVILSPDGKKLAESNVDSKGTVVNMIGLESSKGIYLLEVFRKTARNAKPEHLDAFEKWVNRPFSAAKNDSF
jgi:thioredoxin-related protein